MPSITHLAADLCTVSLPERLRLQYAERGEAAAPLFLFLHGLSDSWYSFSRLLPCLPDSVRAVALTQRGHGDSDKPEGGYAMDDLAADAVALLDQLHVHQAIVVGHSMGSFVARRIAERHPARVRHLVLIGTGPAARNAATDSLWSDVERLADPVDRTFIRSFQMSTINRPVPQEFIDRVIAESGKLPARVWKAALQGMRSYVPAATPITVPTLVLGGVLDAVFSRNEQEAMSRMIPGAVVTLSDGVGHTPQWEEPEVVAAHLMRLLA